MHDIAREIFRKRTREESRRDIADLLERIREKDQFRATLPETTRISFGRHSGLFIGSYEFAGKRLFVEGDTKEEVEATLAMKMGLRITKEEE
jgi:hypothetical protein